MAKTQQEPQQQGHSQNQTQGQSEQHPAQRQQGSSVSGQSSGDLARTTARPMSLRGTSFGRPMSQLWSDFDQLVESFFPRRMGGVDRFFSESQQGGPLSRLGQWGLNIEEREDQVVVRAEAPGFDKGDFDLQVHDNHLILRAEKHNEGDQDGGRTWSRRELYETVPLPQGIERDKVSAQYRNGVLTVTLPRTEQSKARRVEVKE